MPLPGVTLADKQALNQALLRSGASIGEMNCVRRHLSAIKGGRLALACSPARVDNLVMSDVPGDDPLDVANVRASPPAPGIVYHAEPPALACPSPVPPRR